MKQGKIQGLRNKGICTSADIHAVAQKLCPRPGPNWVQPNYITAYVQRKAAARRRFLEAANNPINNPEKKARLDALRAIWRKVKNDT